MNLDSLERLQCPKCGGKVIESEWGYNCAVCSFRKSKRKLDEIIRAPKKNNSGE